MKKYLISAFVVFVSLLKILSFSACTANDPVKQIAHDFDQLREQVEGNTVTEIDREIALRHAELFKRIADGEAGREKEYAQLLKTITDNTIEFSDNEVFIIADDFAKIFSDIAEGNVDFGIQEVKVVEDSSKELLLIIDYIDVRGYSVRMIDGDEMVYFGERLVEYDGSLGKHRIKITFYESHASERFAEQYPLWNAHELKSVPADLGGILKIKGTYSPEHAFVLYIGSDELISISEQDFTRLNRPIGRIELMIKRELS